MIIIFRRLINQHKTNYTIYECILFFQPGKRGGGGEYEAQDGFGWTNGVFLHFLQAYGDKISSHDSVYASATSWKPSVYQPKYLIVVLLNVFLSRVINI